VRGCALCGDDGVVADLEMTGDADLAGEQNAFADMRRTGETGLRTNERVLIDGARMSDLYEVVDLSAAFDARFADRGAIDGRVCADLDIVFEHDATGLRNLEPGFFSSLCVTKTIAADRRVVVNYATRADLAILTHRNAAVNRRVLADRHAVIDRDVRHDANAISNYAIRADHDVCVYLARFSDSCRLVDDRRRMNKRFHRRLGEKLAHRKRISNIRVRRAQNCDVVTLDLNAVAQENSARPRRRNLRRVFFIREKSHIAVTGNVEPGASGDLEIRRTALDDRIGFFCKPGEFHCYSILE